MAFVDNFLFLICNWRQAYFTWELQTRCSVLQHRTKPPTWTHKNDWIILFLFFNINTFIFHWSLMHDLRLLYLRVRQVTLKCKYFFPCLVFVLALPGWITWLGIAGEAQWNVLKGNFDDYTPGTNQSNYGTTKTHEWCIFIIRIPSVHSW